MSNSVILESGFISVSNYILRNLKNLNIELDEFTILLVMQSIQNAEGKFPSNERISEYTGKDIDEVDGYVARLRDKGYIETKTQIDDMGRQCIVFSYEPCIRKVSNLINEQKRIEQVPREYVTYAQRHFARDLSTYEEDLLMDIVDEGHNLESFKNAVLFAIANYGGDGKNISQVLTILREWRLSGVNPGNTVEKTSKPATRTQVDWMNEDIDL